MKTRVSAESLNYFLHYLISVLTSVDTSVCSSFKPVGRISFRFGTLKKCLNTWKEAVIRHYWAKFFLGLFRLLNPMKAASFDGLVLLLTGLSNCIELMVKWLLPPCAPVLLSSRSGCTPAQACKAGIQSPCSARVGDVESNQTLIAWYEILRLLLLKTYHLTHIPRLIKMCWNL